MSDTVNLSPQPNLVILKALQNSFQFMYVFFFTIHLMANGSPEIQMWIEYRVWI